MSKAAVDGASTCAGCLWRKWLQRQTARCRHRSGWNPKLLYPGLGNAASPVVQGDRSGCGSQLEPKPALVALLLKKPGCWMFCCHGEAPATSGFARAHQIEASFFLRYAQYLP